MINVFNLIEGLIGLLESRRVQDAAYIGCMKSGEVVAEEFVSYSTFLNSPVFENIFKLFNFQTWVLVFRGGQWYEPEWWKFGDEKS